MASPPIPDAVEYLWEQLHEMEPSTKLGGIYAFKPGYHSTRKDNKNNWPGNYSIVDSADQGGPDNLAAALDWTFPDAQQADYDLIMKYSKRLLDCGKDPDDDRLNWMREFYGQADKDTGVEGWDFRYVVPVTSDSSHLWHIHFSFSRNALTRENMDKLLEVLRGDDMALTEAEMDKIADKTAKKVWTLDTVKESPDAPKPPYEDPDYGDPNDPSDGNKHWAGKSYLRRTYERGEANARAIEQILAILNTGIPVPGAVNLTPESQAAVADAVADEVAGRLDN